MSDVLLNVVVGVVLLVSMAGTIVPVLPGTILAAGALLVWAVLTGTTAAWVAFAVAMVVLVVGQVLKYLLPHRSLTAAGVPGRTILVGGVAGIVGFFLIPVVGLPVGFVAGVMLAEWLRQHDGAAAWDSTWVAMKATGFSIVIELGALIVATLVWAAAIGFYSGTQQLATIS